MTLLIDLCVFALLVWLVLYLIGVTLPAAVQVPARVVVGVLALVYLLLWFSGRGPVLLPVIR